MEGPKLLKEIRLANLLSYGPEGAPISLEPLNVLIGPNASGKSNLISAIDFLAATPRDLPQFFRAAGGIQEWLWQGGKPAPTASLAVVLETSIGSFRYDIRFTEHQLTPYVESESLEEETGRPVFRLGLHRDGEEESYFEAPGALRNQSIFSQIKAPQAYPELTLVGRELGRCRFFRDWNFGRDSAVRRPQPADLPTDFLLEDASNLALVLSDLTNNHPRIKRLILEKLQLLYDRVEDVTVQVQGGTVQVFFHEKGLRRPVPASRLSDGTLMYLCLLTILLHPSPPPLVCLEEPEIGLHPDALHEVAELLLDAATRTQLVVTTHSDILVSSLSEVPEAVVVCERGEGGTSLRRLEPDKLAEWLERYRLGELWLMGEIGGTRW